MMTTSNFSILLFCHSDRSGGISYCYLSCSTSTPKSSQLGLTRRIKATFFARDHFSVGSPAQLHLECPHNTRSKLTSCIGNRKETMLQFLHGVPKFAET